MLVRNPYEVVIHGTTSRGRIFRSSDWAGRLCGISSSFDKDNRLSYPNWVWPILVNKMRRAAVDKKLEEANPSMFRLLMDFVANNDLRIIDCKQLLEEHGSGVQEVVPEIQALLVQAVEEKHAAEREGFVLPIKIGVEAAETVLREIMAEETTTAFAALGVLRPMLANINRFAEQINTRRRTAGYRLFGIFEEGKHNVTSVYGFHEAFNLANGHHLHIDDTVTPPQNRNKGYASWLLCEVRKMAVEVGIVKIRLNVHVDQERTPTHRLYFNNGFSISAHHFRCDVQ